MQQACVRDVYEWLDTIAPFETKEAFDNVGLLVGSMEQKVEHVLVTLDLSIPVIQMAVEKKAQLIITHHPVMFHPIQQILFDSHEGNLLALLIRQNISLISTHTNIDKTVFSGSARLADKLALSHITQVEDYLFIGDLPTPTTAISFEKTLEQVLQGKVIRFGDEDTIIRKLAIAGGAYDEGYQDACKHGAQALVTGEVRHHNALAAVAMGMVLFEGGHFATEVPMVSFLAECLQKAMNDLQYHVRVYSLSDKMY